MNYPIWELPAPGLLIAVIAVLHVFIAQTAVGGGLYLVLAERLARREPGAGTLPVLRGLGRFFVLVSLVPGAITGVGIWFAITVVHPAATSWLLHVFLWVWVAEWLFFVVEVTAALAYNYGWDRVSPAHHEAIGWFYAVSAWLSLVAINGILGFMLTPGDWSRDLSLWSAFFNPVFWSTLAVRTLASTGLAGLFVLFGLSWLRDGRSAPALTRLAVRSFILPAALLLPVGLAWFLWQASAAGVPVAATLGVSTSSLGALVSSFAGPVPFECYPLARKAAQAAVLVWTALGLLVTVGHVVCRDRYGRLGGLALLVLGLLGVGTAEWVREDLRKPYVLSNAMFVNGVQLPGLPLESKSPFTIDRLRERGVLATARWVRWPATGTPGSRGPQVERRPSSDPHVRGEMLFKLQCASCHTLRGHLGIARLVCGCSELTVDSLLQKLAVPVDAAGEVTPWSNPDSTLRTWRDRRMPPFAGTPAERRDLATYLAAVSGGNGPRIPAATTLELPVVPSTSGSPSQVLSPEETAGRAYFEENCATCHGCSADFPMAARMGPWAPEVFYEMLGRLPQVDATMEKFDGTDEQRWAVARFLTRMSKNREEKW